jgi:hypothetical protein
MKTLVPVAAVLACALSLNAQITATLKPLPDASTELRIRSDGAVPLSAFAATAHVRYQIGGKDVKLPLELDLHKLYVDPLIDGTAVPLLPKEERTVSWSRRIPRGGGRSGALPVPVFDEPIVTTGIFADGSTTGDTTLLAGLLLRRSTMLQAVETALGTLFDAGRHNVPRDRLTEQFRTMADLAGRWYLTEEQQVGRGLYQSILGKLINLPDLPLGAAFPPTSFVEQETALLRKQRATLEESRPGLETVAAR